MLDDDVIKKYLQMLEMIEEDYISFAGGKASAGEDIQKLTIWIKGLIFYTKELERMFVRAI